MIEILGVDPPFSTEQVRRYLALLYTESVGKTTADQVRRAIDWWHEVYNTPSPCNPHIKRLCKAMVRTLPKQGNPPRRPLSEDEGPLLLTTCDAKIISGGDHWHRNSTILAMDLTTGLRINDILPLRRCDLKWEFNPLQLTLWIVDGKTDALSTGTWSIKYVSDITNPSDGICRLWSFIQYHPAPQTDYIFKSTTNNGHISYDSMLAVLHDLAKLCHLPQPDLIGWHSCRKTRADLEHSSTEGDMNAVRAILGHTKDSRSTNFYLSRPPPTYKRKK